MENFQNKAAELNIPFDQLAIVKISSVDQELNSQPEDTTEFDASESATLPANFGMEVFFNKSDVGSLPDWLWKFLKGIGKNNVSSNPSLQITTFQNMQPSEFNLDLSGAHDIDMIKDVVKNIIK